jgi:hypothetical protein
MKNCFVLEKKYQIGHGPNWLFYISDIIHMEQREDHFRNSFVRLKISKNARIMREGYDKYRTILIVPGTIEEIAQVIGGNSDQL